MLRLGTLATVLALAATVVSTQGCASASGSEDVSEGNADLSSSVAGDRFLDVPFYFSLPKSEVTIPLNRNAYSYPTLWNPSIGNANAGLRMIVIQQAGQSPAQKTGPRLDMGTQLGKAGVLQEGDVALTFRPELANTMAYPHIQQGITHSSLVYVKNGVAFHVDSPLDDVTTGNGTFTTEHFVGGAEDHGVDAMQIVRPRGLTDARKVQLQSWIDRIVSSNAQRAAIHAQVGFQSNYLTPIFQIKNLTTKQTVTKLGQILMRTDKTSSLDMYCSELAWHLLALSNCSETDITNAPAEGAECVAPIFAPMPLIGTADAIGLGEGPLRMIQTAPPADEAGLLPQVFTTDAAKANKVLSSGHRQVASQLEQLGLIDGLKLYYTKTLAGASADELLTLATKMNNTPLPGGLTLAPNYSPTAFFTQALQDDANRPVDYVATVVFTDSAADYAKAKTLAANGTP